jgi:Domain of unknown function (DUF5052)
MRKWRYVVGALIAGIVLSGAAATGCEPAEFAVDDAVAQWEGREATLYTYDNNSGQTTATVTGKAIYPFRNTAFDTSDGESTKAGSVMSVSVGDNVVDIVGSSTVICDDRVVMVPRDQIDVAASSTDSAIPWLNILKRNVSNLFVGQSRLAVIKTQNDVPVAAFTGDSVTMVSGNADIPNSTWFKIQDGGVSGYCFVYRVNYIVVDTAILD